MSRILRGMLALLAVMFAVPAMAGGPQPGLFIKPGEVWAFTVVDGQPVDAHKLSSGEKPKDGEIVASFSGDGSMLQVRNSGDKPYNYQAFVASKPEDKGKRTSVCTLIPNVAMMESWPGGLPGLRLTNFTDAGDGMICA